MSISALLGQYATLTLQRLMPQGAYLTDPKTMAVQEEILLPRSEVKESMKVGDKIKVFIYLDSEDRPTATLLTPRIVKGEVCFLTVKDLTSFGAFFDWGLAKDLLVPVAEQTQRLRIGESHPVSLYVDSSGRLAGTMKVSERLSNGGPFQKQQWLQGECWRKDPELGMFVILEKKYIGLLPAYEPSQMKKGERGKFRVVLIHPDGKIVLSRRGTVYQELEKDASLILERLKKPHAPKMSDSMSPEQIKLLFGISKKAFKRAVGTLLKKRLVQMDEDGNLKIS